MCTIRSPYFTPFSVLKGTVITLPKIFARIYHLKWFGQIYNLSSNVVQNTSPAALKMMSAFLLFARNPHCNFGKIIQSFKRIPAIIFPEVIRSLYYCYFTNFLNV